jgi:hypothetical protein
MTMSFTSEEAKALMGGDASTTRTTSAPGHWISFALKDRGSLGGLRCVAYFEDGSEQWGTLSANNTVRFERYENGNACTHIEFRLDDNTGSSGSVTESLLSAIAG